MNGVLRWGALCAALPVVSACSMFPTFTYKPATQNKPELVAPKSFKMSGRISIAWEQQRWIGAIEWDYRPAIENVALSIAGQDFARFERYEGRARARTMDGHQFDEPTWSALTQRAIGVPLPFEHAPFWVRGEPAPSLATQKPEPDQFIQGGWTISTLARDELSKRPQRLRWHKDAVSLTLVIDTWTEQ